MTKVASKAQIFNLHCVLAAADPGQWSPRQQRRQRGHARDRHHAAPAGCATRPPAAGPPLRRAAPQRGPRGGSRGRPHPQPLRQSRLRRLVRQQALWRLRVRGVLAPASVSAAALAATERFASAQQRRPFCRLLRPEHAADRGSLGTDGCGRSRSRGAPLAQHGPPRRRPPPTAGEPAPRRSGQP